MMNGPPLEHKKTYLTIVGALNGVTYPVEYEGGPLHKPRFVGDTEVHLAPVFQDRSIFDAKPMPRQQIGYEWIRPRWMKPGPDGKLIPR